MRKRQRKKNLSKAFDRLVTFMSKTMQIPDIKWFGFTESNNNQYYMQMISIIK